MTRTSIPMPDEPVMLPKERPDLGARLARGDEQAFDEVVRRYQGDVARFVRRLLGWRDGGECDDLVQEVFVQVYLKRHTFRGDSAVKSWLTRIAVNQVRDFQRRRMAGLQALKRLILRRPREVAPPAAEVDETADRVRHAVRKLAARDREIIVLHYLEELPLAEVARIVGAKEGTVSVRLYRARKTLARLLGSFGETHGA